MQRIELLRALVGGRLRPGFTPSDIFPGEPNHWPPPEPDPERPGHRRLGPWMVELKWTLDRDWRPICAGLEIWWAGSRRDKPDELTAAMVRSLPLGTFADRDRYYLAEEAAGIVYDDAHPLGTDFSQVVVPRRVVERAQELLDHPPGKRGRPPQRGADFYVAVATTYAEALARGEHPVQAVMQTRLPGNVRLSRPGASKAVSRARELGFLSPAERPGRAGGNIPRDPGGEAS